MTKKVLILEDARFIWDEEEVKTFVEMWSDNKSSYQIAEVLNCKIMDVALLVMDQAEKGKIKQRIRGIV